MGKLDRFNTASFTKIPSEIITIRVPTEIKEDFFLLMKIWNTNASANLNKHIQKVVLENKNLIEKGRELYVEPRS